MPPYPYPIPVTLVIFLHLASVIPVPSFSVQKTYSLLYKCTYIAIFYADFASNFHKKQKIMTKHRILDE